MKLSTISNRHWLWMFWTCVLAILVLSLLPLSPQLPTTGWDKTNHLLAFCVLTMLGNQAYRGRTLMVLLGLLAYGGLIEILQSFTPDRMAEWADLLADSLGLAAGLALGALLEKLGGPRI
jgi:VanZ family protein